jgi:hypothetical protein
MLFHTSDVHIIHIKTNTNIVKFTYLGTYQKQYNCNSAGASTTKRNNYDKTKQEKYISCWQGNNWD